MSLRNAPLPNKFKKKNKNLILVLRETRGKGHACLCITDISDLLEPATLGSLRCGRHSNMGCLKTGRNEAGLHVDACPE